MGRAHTHTNTHAHTNTHTRAQVRPIPAENVVSPHAYLLFYVRRDVVNKTLDDLFPREPGRPRVDLSKIGRKKLMDRCAVM